MGKKDKIKQQTKPVEKEEFTLKEYFYINVIFWVFLLILAILIFFTTGGQWDPVMKNVFTFIFLVFGGGFTIVSIFDYIYERIANKNVQNNN